MKRPFPQIIAAFLATAVVCAWAGCLLLLLTGLFPGAFGKTGKGMFFFASAQYLFLALALSSIVWRHRWWLFPKSSPEGDSLSNHSPTRPSPQSLAKWSRNLLLLFLVVGTLGQVDYFSLKHRQSPIFSFDMGFIFDGGTHFWIGLGYGVTQHHGTTYAISHGHGTNFHDADFAVGPELSYIFPLNPLNRQEIRFVPKPQDP